MLSPFRYLVHLYEYNSYDENDEVNSMKSIKEIVKDKSIARLIEWDLHPFDAVTRYLEWGTNWSRGLSHAKSCNEMSAYFKINATKRPARLMLVKQSHHDYEVVAEIEAPQDLIDRSVEFYGCHNAACGITEDLKSWLKAQAYEAS